MSSCKSCNFGTPDLINGYCRNCWKARESLKDELIEDRIEGLTDGYKPQVDWFLESQVAIRNAHNTMSRVICRSDIDWDVVIKIARFFMEEAK